ncbi:MAG: choice-of-anchor B family protein, partial [Saprospiraceae bacterium]|nr:choice-of-anchor B family protein [Saprospiraceae bacterium]
MSFLPALQRFGVLLFSFLTLAVHAQNLNVAMRSKVTFPNQTMANICGYAANGHEYALCGGSKGLYIVEVTNPAAPVKIVQIPGPDNLWKEIKTYQHYAYVTTEGGQGLQIVDLSALPSPNPAHKQYTGDGSIQNQLNSIHALHIDTTAGYLYAFGSNLSSGGAVIMDIKTDPWNPVYVGSYDQNGYIHDGFVDNDTLYACHINQGFFSMVAMTDKQNPVVLGAQTSPNFFTHNAWLTKNRKYLLTTDEVNNSFLASFDVTDPTDLKLLDKVQSNPGSNSMVHNTHIVGDYAVTSWYNDGVTIVDVSDPTNLVQVGNYDIAPNLSGGGSTGCWGVYPFLPSGNLIATTMGTDNGTGELWVLTPTYVRASYLKGSVTAASTGNPLSNVKIEIVGGDPGTIEFSGNTGQYSMGQATAGAYTIRASKIGYQTVEQTVTLTTAMTATLNFVMPDIATYSLSGTVVRAGDMQPIPFAHIGAIGGANFETTADANGQFTLPGIYQGNYQLVAGAWGYQYQTFQNQGITANTSKNFVLSKGYRDDFVFDYGWEVSGTSTQGIWEIAKPVEVNPGILLSPAADFTGDVGNTCYVTGNTSSEVGIDDVESGTMILTSPPMDLTTYNEPILKGALFFTSITINQQSFDSLTIFITNGTETAQLAKFGDFIPAWRLINTQIKPHIALSNNMRLILYCDENPAFPDLDSYEVAFDFFRITEGAPTGTTDIVTAVKMVVMPNPFKDQASIACDLPDGLSGIVKITDLNGKT